MEQKEPSNSQKFTSLCYDYVYDLSTLRDRVKMLLKRLDWGNA